MISISENDNNNVPATHPLIFGINRLHVNILGRHRPPLLLMVHLLPQRRLVHLPMIIPVHPLCVHKLQLVGMGQAMRVQIGAAGRLLRQVLVALPVMVHALVMVVVVVGHVVMGGLHQCGLYVCHKLCHNDELICYIMFGGSARSFWCSVGG